MHFTLAQKLREVLKKKYIIDNYTITSLPIIKRVSIVTTSIFILYLLLILTIWNDVYTFIEIKLKHVTVQCN